MTDAGPTIAGTGATGGSGVAWSNPTRVNQDAASYATAALTSGGPESADLYASGFGFAIPSTATIDGLVLTFDRLNTAAGGCDDGGGSATGGVWFTKDGSTTHAGTNLANGTDWTGSAVNASYGSSSSLSGQTWTPAEINASTFGAILRARRVPPGGSPVPGTEAWRITITYTDAGVTSSVTRAGTIGI